MSFTFDSQGMLAAVKGGAEHMALQKAHVDYLAAVEAQRRAALGDATLPRGTFDTRDEAWAYINDAKANGKFPAPIDDGNGNLSWVYEISSPYNGHGPTVWVTAVFDEDPNPGLVADLKNIES
jgi:hypothetical protein